MVICNTRMKNVLIIGSTGQIGSELTMKLRHLHPEGNIVAGYIPGWEARLSDAPTAAELENFRSLSGMEIPSGLATRKEILQFIYDRL